MELKIQAKLRQASGKQNKKLRKAGILPAVVYGRNKETLSLEIPDKDFQKVYQKAGESTIVDLAIDGKGEKKVLIHEVAKHYMKDEPIHIDFYEVDLTRKIHAKVPVHFVGVASAVKESGGVLIKNLTEIEVEALPMDLPHSVEVSIEPLKSFDVLIRVADIKVSDKVKILGRLEDVVVSVQAPRTEAELLELEKPTAEAEKAAIEGLTKEEEKPEGDEGAGAADAETKEPEETKEKKKEPKA
ncbi:MAG: 50S ribosomal protein L25 [Candidatus Doudnabacteria bacterium]|nr:50S ribosomal protein L25 [bacterium]MDZ4244204.1 50S ribosomal protein L25 [Candidatus Doudnabacteria bacterium]